LRVRVYEGFENNTLTPTPLYPCCLPPGFALPLTISSGDKWLEKFQPLRDLDVVLP
jgi:hypothetical protein